jgi:hypothetical protein
MITTIQTQLVPQEDGAISCLPVIPFDQFPEGARAAGPDPVTGRLVWCVRESLEEPWPWDGPQDEPTEEALP